MRFLKDEDYDVQLRAEISAIIDETTEKRKLIKAESMATAQIRNHLAGKYDIAKIFAPMPEGATEDTRDQYIVMLVIDIALYHLWSKEGRNNVPKLRELRYTDALKWLSDVQNGAAADLPLITDESGLETSDIRIWSKNLPENNRF